MFFAVMVAVVCAIVAIVSPETSWYLSHGWKFKRAEPSDLALQVIRVSGVVALVFCVVYIFSSCSQGLNENGWVENFKSKLVSEDLVGISVGDTFSPGIQFSEDQKDAFVEELSHLQFTKRNKRQGYGYGEILTLDFDVWYNVEIYSHAGQFWIVLDSKEVEYTFSSDVLKGIVDEVGDDQVND